MVRRLILSALLAAAVAAPAASADPTRPPYPYWNWPTALPPMPDGTFRASTEPDCRDGAPSCIDATIVKMQRRLDHDVPRCDHRTVFSLAYLRVTQDVRDALRTGFFSDAAWLGHFDAAFARLYFDAYDNWAAGRIDKVTPAWQLAFGAAVDRQVPALGNFLMSMNAHINRDMPYALAGVGLVTPEGASRKPDHDRYNPRLAALYQPVLAEIARRFDPTADDVEAGGIDDEAAYAILASWREGVWRNAERLVSATSDAQRAMVAASIDRGAELIGRGLLETMRYRGESGRAQRDAWCAAHGGQAG